MKGVGCIVVSCVIVHVLSSSTLKPKQLNLQLQTVLRFDKKDQKNDLAIIDQVQHFLQKIKNVVRSRGSRRQLDNEMSFTDFILQAADILKQFNDNDLEDTFAIIDDESKRYIYRDSNLQDLFGDRDVRRYVSNKLDVFKDMPADMLRRYLDKATDFIRNKTDAGNDNLLEVVNNIYSGASDKLKNAIEKLHLIRKSSTADLESSLKETLRSLFDDHYSSLRQDVKEELINMLKHYWRAFSNKKNIDNNKRNAFRPYELSSTTKNYPNIKRKPHLQDIYNKKDKSFHDLTRTDEKYKLPSMSDEKGTIEIRFGPGSRDEETRGSTHGHMKNYSKRKSKKHESDSALGFTKGLEEDYDIKYRGIRDSFEDKLQTTTEIMLEGKPLSDESFAQNSKRKHEQHRPQQIVLDYNKMFDVGLARRGPGLFNISVASEEGYNKDQNSETEVTKRKQYENFNPVEGMSIEKFGNNDFENTVMRKSNVNDTFEPDINTNTTGVDVHKLIENIQKRIEDVEEQVQYVKSLKVGADDRPTHPKFKAIGSDENRNGNETIRFNSRSIEKDNENFFFDNSHENVTDGSITFRDHEDSSELKHENITNNATHDNVTENTLEFSDTNRGNQSEPNSTSLPIIHLELEDFKNSIVPLPLGDTTGNLTEKHDKELVSLI